VNWYIAVSRFFRCDMGGWVALVRFPNPLDTGSELGNLTRVAPTGWVGHCVIGLYRISELCEVVRLSGRISTDIQISIQR